MGRLTSATSVLPARASGEKVCFSRDELGFAATSAGNDHAVVVARGGGVDELARIRHSSLQTRAPLLASLVGIWGGRWVPSCRVYIQRGGTPC
jgi:hypothetical protein